MVRFDRNRKRPTEEELKKWYDSDTRRNRSSYVGMCNKKWPTFDEWKKGRFNDRFDITLGFNTKQFWIYDGILDVLIDPPTEVLDSLTYWWENADKAEKELADIVAKDPDWLYDRCYWYNGQMEI